MKKRSKLKKRLKVKVIASSSQEKITKRADGLLKIKVQSPAEKGQANKKVQKLLAEKYNTKLSNIKIIKGKTNSIKIIQINK